MNTVIINASPRVGGNSAFLAEKLKEKFGDDCSIINLRDLDIHWCRGCRSCKINNTLCIIKDDMQDIYKSLLQANKVIFISPNHMGYLSSLGKIFTDRWYCLKSDNKVSKFEEGKKALFFFVQGSPSRERGKNTEEWAKHFFTNYGFKYFSMVIPACSNDNTSGIENKLDEILMNAALF